MKVSADFRPLSAAIVKIDKFLVDGILKEFFTMRPMEGGLEISAESNSRAVSILVEADVSAKKGEVANVNSEQLLRVLRVRSKPDKIEMREHKSKMEFRAKTGNNVMSGIMDILSHEGVTCPKPPKNPLATFHVSGTTAKSFARLVKKTGIKPYLGLDRMDLALMTDPKGTQAVCYDNKHMAWMQDGAMKSKEPVNLAVGTELLSDIQSLAGDEYDLLIEDTGVHVASEGIRAWAASLNKEAAEESIKKVEDWSVNRGKVAKKDIYSVVLARVRVQEILSILSSSDKKHETTFYVAKNGKLSLRAGVPGESGFIRVVTDEDMDWGGKEFHCDTEMLREYIDCCADQSELKFDFCEGAAEGKDGKRDRFMRADYIDKKNKTKNMYSMALKVGD